jgi:hypothetical protein
MIMHKNQQDIFRQCELNPIKQLRLLNSRRIDDALLGGGVRLRDLSVV